MSVKECHVLPTRTRLAAFLRQHGAGLPPDSIAAMTSPKHRKNWVVLCDDDGAGEPVAVGHYEETDWFSCTLKGLAVKDVERGKGYGKAVTHGVVDKARAHKTRDGLNRCLVLLADVTSDNTASLKSLQGAGFEIGDEFCWASGQRPAQILHLVRFKPQRGTCQ